jgi:hypothetical protein
MLKDMPFLHLLLKPRKEMGLPLLYPTEMVTTPPNWNTSYLIVVFSRKSDA